MIIRRRHTANFTTIGNALFEDERLALDEVGIMAFLLSKPHDWEIRRPALMRRWKIGRDAMKRIMTNLIRSGWCRAQKTRLENGTFHIIYEIRDQPGRELSEDEVRGALSLVSSGVADGESDVDDATDQLRETRAPPTGEPGVDDRGVVTRHWPIDDSLNPEQPRTESTQSGRVFVDVRKAWPPDHILSMVACEALHAGLTDEGRSAAYDGIRPYLDDCKGQSRKVCDLATYYRERRWERFAAKATGSAFVAIRRGTPQAFRWREYFERAEPHKLTMFDQLMMERGTYTAPSEWPPPLPPKQPEDAERELADRGMPNQ